MSKDKKLSTNARIYRCNKLINNGNLTFHRRAKGARLDNNFGTLADVYGAYGCVSL